MEENILKELVKSRKVLKRKFQSIKLGDVETTERLEKTFKPLTEPLKSLVKLRDDNISRLIIQKDPTSKSNILNEKYEKSLYTSTPKTKIKKQENYAFNSSPQKSEKEEIDDYEVEEEDSNGDTFYSQTDDIDLSYLKRNKKLDKVFGPHKNNNGDWQFGNANLIVKDDKIIIGNQNWAYTPGLFELLFYQTPKHYDASELEIYKKILLNTNAHKRNYDPNGQLKGNRGYKYTKIIKKIFAVTHTGNGLMSVNLRKPNYIYWDDPNELVERLKLLVASQNAGHTNQNNEIISIIEELREANIIY